jgi:hypothetical protein
METPNFVCVLLMSAPLSATCKVSLEMIDDEGKVQISKYAVCLETSEYTTHS